MIGVLDTELGDGYWTCQVRDQTLRVYVDPLRFADPWWEPESGDRVMLVEVSTRGLAVLWLMGKGSPTYERVQA